MTDTTGAGQDNVQDNVPDNGGRPTFADLGIDERVLKALAKVGYETPSPIQAATIPPLLEGRHVVGLAQTGTGKTAAFAVPILPRIDSSGRRRCSSSLPRVSWPSRSPRLLRGTPVTPWPPRAAVYGGQGYPAQLRLWVAVPKSWSAPPAASWTTWRRALITELRSRAGRGRRDAQDGLCRRRRDDLAAPRPKGKSRCSPPRCRRPSDASQEDLTNPAEITVKNHRHGPDTRAQPLVSHPQKDAALTRILEAENSTP